MQCLGNHNQGPRRFAVWVVWLASVVCQLGHLPWTRRARHFPAGPQDNHWRSFLP
ncbi:hypothetical protein GE21DRAFT_1278008 [Neurospora crassa]|nr:hypothetical protein GE21DRAFT_1278008 [Neurospora crassa]